MYNINLDIYIEDKETEDIDKLKEIKNKLEMILSNSWTFIDDDLSDNGINGRLKYKIFVSQKDNYIYEDVFKCHGDIEDKKTSVKYMEGDSKMEITTYNKDN